MGHKEKLAYAVCLRVVLAEPEISFNWVKSEPMEAVDVVRGGNDRVLNDAWPIPEGADRNEICGRHVACPVDAVVAAGDEETLDISPHVSSCRCMVDGFKEEMFNCAHPAVDC